MTTTPVVRPSWILARGIGLVVVASFLLAGMDALGKHLMQQSLQPAQVIWARYLFHTIVVGLVFGAQHHRNFLRPQRPALQVLRGLCLLAVTVGMYVSIRTVSLADATAIMFLAPVLVGILAARWLHEPVHPLHWLALAMGFGGVMFIVRPGFAEVQAVMLLPLISALCLAVYFVITRFLRDQDGEYTTLFHTTAIGSIVMTALVPLFWVAPSGIQWILLVLVGVLGASGHLLLIRAFHLVSASTLAPYLNAQLLAATLYSAWLFDDPLSSSYLAGAVLIVAAGILTWRLGRG